ncbi:MAG: sensor histidine kinase [Sphingobacteriales bacterium]|nr:sensor histidine kinase [Sphingobacteriales bacterium]
MRVIIHIIVWTVCLPYLSAGQTSRIDSLRKELPKSKPDSIKVHDRIRISWYLMDRNDSAAAWKYGKEADSIADKTKNPVLKGIVYEHFGFLYSRGDSKKAITYFLQAENILKEYPESPAAVRSMASLALNTGYEHMKVSDDVGALDYFFAGIKRYEAMDSNHFNLPILYTNIINSYYNLGKFETALSYCAKAYPKIMTMGNNASRMGICLNYGRLLRKLNRRKESDYYFERGRALADSLQDDFYLAKYYQLMTMFSHEEGDDVQAYSYIQAGLPHIEKTGFAADITSYYNWVATVSTALKKYGMAGDYLDKAYALAKENDFLLMKKDVFGNRAELEKSQGHYQAAVSYLDSFGLLRDSLLHLENADRIEFLDARYQAEKKEVQIGQLQAEKEVQKLNLQRKNIWNYILAGAALLLAVISFLVFRNFRQRQLLQQQRIQELETQQQLLATEAVLKGEEQERTRLAKDLHDGLGGMLSGIKYSFQTMKGNLIMTPENQQAFERSMDMLDSSIREMRRVAHNMMPEALVKFGLTTAIRDFCEEINRSGALQVSYQSIGMEKEQISQTTAITIYRIVQELLNNTMKHAAARTAIVQLSKTGRGISITVEDDGKGFDTALLKGARGIGWSNIQSRVEYLKGRLDIQSEPGKGVSVHIDIDEQPAP